MKSIYRLIRARILNPNGYDVLIAAIIAVLFGNFAGEVISRDFNAYFQAFMMLGTLGLAIIAVRMFAVWILNYIKN